MNRLTEKVKGKYSYNIDVDYSPELADGYDFIYGPDIESAVSKLGHLEDVEEEYGIDLITLFKALKDGAWFRNPYYPDQIIYIKNLEFNIDFDKKRFDIKMDYFVKFYDYRTGGAFFLFKDCGKTWALIREELENG